MQKLRTPLLIVIAACTFFGVVLGLDGLMSRQSPIGDVMGMIGMLIATTGAGFVLLDAKGR